MKADGQNISDSMIKVVTGIRRYGKSYLRKCKWKNGIPLDFKGFLGYYNYRKTKIMVKTMTKTVHLL